MDTGAVAGADIGAGVDGPTPAAAAIGETADDDTGTDLGTTNA
jgi:hypothetical protein